MGIHNVGKANRDQRIAEEYERALAQSRLPERRCPLHKEPSSFPIDHPEADIRIPWAWLTEGQRSEIWKDQMLENGWCYHQIDHLSRIHSLKVLSYLATLERSAHQLVDHKPCVNFDVCVAYNIDKATYKTRHVDPDCRCSMLSTPYSDLIETIRNGKIPLISIEGGTATDSVCQLRVHPRSRKTDYIALSHVWSDGLGNPNENALPLCQVERLKANLLALKKIFGVADGPILFWMDTLCIPVGVEEKPLRLLQIDKMASIYKGSTSSLVLDAELMATVSELKPVYLQDSKKEDTVSRLTARSRARIACSTWMCRSWTLQEGQLAPTIAIQFQDEAIVVGRHSRKNGEYQERSLSEGINPSESPREARQHIEVASQDGESTILDARSSPRECKQIGRTLSLECDCVGIALERAFYSTFFEQRNMSADLVAVWNELAGRSTTKSSDIFWIIASILGLELRGLLRYYDAGEAFQTILLSLDSVPLSLFFNTGPRKNQNGNHQNRWIPLKISQDTLTADHLLKIFPSYLCYKYSSNDNGKGISAYTINSVLPLKSKMRLCFENERTLYTVSSSNSDADELDTRRFKSSCVILEDADASERLSTRRGACFYIRDNPERSNPDDRHWWYRALRTPRPGWKRFVRPQVDLVFNCPLRLRPDITGECSSPRTDEVHCFAPVRSPCEFKIHYDPLARFKPLRKRSNEFTHSTGTLFLRLLFPGCLISAPFLFGLGLSLPRPGAFIINPVFIIVLGAAIAGALARAYTYLAALADWKYIRSFENMASRRPPGGIV